MIIIKKKFGCYNFPEHLQKAGGTLVKNQWYRSYEIFNILFLFLTNVFKRSIIDYTYSMYVYM